MRMTIDENTIRKLAMDLHYSTDLIWDNDEEGVEKPLAFVRALAYNDGVNDLCKVIIEEMQKIGAEAKNRNPDNIMYTAQEKESSDPQPIWPRGVDVPKPPILRQEYIDNGKKFWYECPNCGSTLTIVQETECAGCGQRIKWESVTIAAFGGEQHD